MLTDIGLTLVVPMRNEEHAVDRVLDDLRRASESFPHPFQLVCVDDASVDSTPSLLAEWSTKWMNLRVVNLTASRGYGHAIRQGLNCADFRYVGWMDGDGQYEAADVFLLFRELRQLRRYAAVGVRGQRADAWHRRVLGTSGNFLAQRIVGWPVTDVDCGLKIVDTTELPVSGLISNGGLISTELLTKCDYRDVVEVAVSHHPRMQGESSGVAPRTLLGLFVDLCRVTSSTK